jgi:hypothetical protein
MIGVIMPLVQAARRTTSWIFLLLLYGLGTVASSVLLGLALAWAGSRIRVAGGPAEITIAALGFVLAASDARAGPLRTPSLRRQTCPTWYQAAGSQRAFLFWGLDLGTGFSTIRVGSLYWLLVPIVALLVPTTVAPLVTGAYGASLAVGLAIIVVRARGCGDSCAPAVAWLGRARAMRYGSAAVLVLFSCSLLVSGVLRR